MCLFFLVQHGLLKALEGESKLYRTMAEKGYDCVVGEGSYCNYF